MKHQDHWVRTINIHYANSLWIVYKNIKNNYFKLLKEKYF